MTIMQALVFGGGRLQDESFNTNEQEFDPAGTKPLVTVIPITNSGILRFPIDPFQTINDLTIDGFLTIEMWGGGGCSGACREGRSGSGGPGGYSRILVNTRGLGVYNNGFLNIRVGGGGGQPNPYNIPSDEYVGEDALNIATIQEIAGAQISNAVSLGSITPGLETTSVSTRTVSTITPVSTGSISGSATVPLSALLIAQDVIFIASSCDDGTIGALPGYTTLTTRTAPIDAIDSLNGPSYRLQYKVVAATDPETTLAQVTGLTATSDTGKSVSHIAYAFRGVDPTFGIYDQGDDTTNLTTYSNSINLPNFDADIRGCTLLSFGYFDNRSTAVTAPAGYTALGPTASSTNSPAGITRKTGITINGVVGDTFIQTQDASPPDNPPVTFDIGGLSAGDFVLVAACSSGLTPNSFGAGFTQVADGLGQPNVRYGYTFATGTTVTVQNTNNASGGGDNNIAYTVLVFTGVDEESPYDVTAPARANGNNPNPDSPGIEPITDGCMIVAVAAIDNDVITSVGGVGGFTLGPFAATSQGPDNSSCVMTAFTLQTTAAPIDPPAFTTNGDNVWKSYTFALRPKGIDSTVVSAYINLTTTSGTNIAGGSFTTTLRGPSAGTSILLRPTETISAAPALIFPAATVGDLIICASVSDGGTMNVPTGFTAIEQDNTGNPSYQLSYKYYDALDVGATINGLSANGTINNNPLDISLNGRPAIARHVAYSFSGVNPGSVVVNDGVVSSNTGTNPNPTSFGIPNSSNYASVPFLFISNRSISAITPPTTYTLGTVYRAGTDNTGTNEATLVNAFKSLPNENEDDPASFTIQSLPYKTLTIGIEPTATAGGFTGTLPITGYTSLNGDLIVSATVVDAGTPATPTGFDNIGQQNGDQNNPGYQLSYRFTGAGETQVSGLTPNIGNRGTAHIVRVFRGVERNTSPTAPGRLTFTTASNGNGNTINYNPIDTYRPDDFVLTFAFVDDKNVTVSSSPLDYSSFIVQSVSTTNNSTEDGTIISSFTTTPGSPSENPGSIDISDNDNWNAFTIKLSPSIRNKFDIGPTQGYGGSSGGYSAIYNGITGDLLACVGGGGGGGGGTVANINAATPVGTIDYNSPLSAGGDGGGGGGCNQNGNPGTDGNSFLYTNPTTSRTTAGSGGGGGTQIAGGTGGISYTIDPILLTRTNITQLNPGENGVGIGITESGGRGANSPYNTSDLPLQGANATGGFVQGRAGGATRTNSPINSPQAGRDCGGGGGAGYFTGGGGGGGDRGGGGGGGGGSGWAAPGIIVQTSSSGIGTIPGGIESAFYGGRIAAGGERAFGNTTVGGFSIGPVVQGNPGGNGLVVITYQSL